MKLISTTIAETYVHMRFADHSDPEKAAEWIDFQVPVGSLKVPDAPSDYPLENLNARYLGSIRKAALQYVRDAISAEGLQIATH